MEYLGFIFRATLILFHRFPGYYLASESRHIQSKYPIHSLKVILIAVLIFYNYNSLAQEKVLVSDDSTTFAEIRLSQYLAKNLTKPPDSLDINSKWIQSAQKNLNGISNKADHYLCQIDSLLQAKGHLVQSRISHLQSKATDKFQGIDSISNTQAGFLDEKLDNLTPEQYTVKMKGINESLLSYKSQITDSEELSWVEHYTSQLDQVEGVVKQYQDKLLNLEELGALKGYGHQLEQLSQESGGYFQEVGNILSGGLTDDSPLMKQLESKIGKYPAFQELQKLNAELEQVRNIPQDQQDQLKSYQDKDKLKSQAKELLNKHFSEHQDKLQAAQQKLATFKKKYSSIQSTKVMSTAVKRNSLGGKPLSERLVIGGTFQINPSYSITNGNTSTTGTTGNTGTSKVPTSVDLSPLLGYRFNKKLTLGIGGTYRAILEIDEFEARDQVYGYRGFVQQDAIKGFFIHGEYENLNTATNTTSTEEANRSWQPGGLTGIGKEFSFFKQVKGQVMVLYNFLHEEGVSPYNKPWVIRFGFNIQGLESKLSANEKTKM